MSTYSDYTTVLNKAKAALSKVGRSYAFSCSPSWGSIMYPAALTEIMNAIDYAHNGMTAGSASPGCSSNHSYSTCESNYTSVQSNCGNCGSNWEHRSYGNG